MLNLLDKVQWNTQQQMRKKVRLQNHYNEDVTEDSDKHSKYQEVINPMSQPEDDLLQLQKVRRKARWPFF